MICEHCNKKIKAFNLKSLGKAMQRHINKCKEGKQKMETGEEYFVLLLGDLKIPFFPATSKGGKKFYQARLQIWRNEKGSKKSQTEEMEVPVEKIKD